MASNTIIHRVFEFMIKYPPFSRVEEKQLLDLAQLVKIVYADREEILFKEGDPPGEYLYLVREGSVSLSLNHEVVDICDEGDLFGVRSMLSGKPYVLEAIATSETLLYLIPINPFQKIVESNSAVALYFAAELASGQGASKEGQDPTPIKNKYQLKSAPNILTASLKRRQLVSCGVKVCVKEVAQMMQKHRVGSMIITNDQGCPMGIITDTDLRANIATGNVSIEATIDSIMNSPVVTVQNGASLMDMMILMMNNNIHHLCITEDGSDKSKALGVYSERDMLLAQANHPAIIVKEITKTNSVAYLSELRDKAEELLKQYLEQGVGASVVTNILSIINDSIIRKAIELALKQVNDQAASLSLNFCWLSLGSEGREEQLLRTDVDNAILYENPDENQSENAKSYFLKIGALVNETLMACGFEKCPADIMASNPEYCLSLGEWKLKFEQWINTPAPQALMNSTIFFDFRSVYGDQQLEVSLQDHLTALIKKGGTFINHLAKNVLQNPPPLTFFKNLMVEKSGEHKNEFDIKKRAMMPLADAARVLTLDHGQIDVHNTPQRFKKLSTLEPKQSELFNEASMAYEWLMLIRARFGLANEDSGRFLPIEALNKIEKQMLRNAFVPIKEVQRLLEVRFQLDYFRS